MRRRRVACLAAIAWACTAAWVPAAAAADPAADAPDAAELGAGLTILNGFLVFFMQLGFINLELGYGRSKNIQHILTKNALNLTLTALCWWAVGYAFANGRSAGGVIGVSRFFQDGLQPADGTRGWFFSWTFAASTATIVSGCLAERTALLVYPALTVLLTAWVHPVASHWTWNQGGWLSDVSRCQYLDYAGGTVVHCVGGLTGLVGAWFVGPRIGRFEDGQAKHIPGHDVSSVAIGTLMLWFGWYGFNTGSVYLYAGNASALVDHVALNMTLSACCSGLTVLLVNTLAIGTFDLCACCNGLLMGLVAATGSCGYVPAWASVVIGIMAGLLYRLLSRLLLVLKIDDPLDSSVVHVGGGLLGTVLNGAFARPTYVALLRSGNAGDAACGGFFLSTDDGGLQLGMQLLGATAICAWTVAFASLAFWLLSRVCATRVDQATELAGMDNMEHGGAAYPGGYSCAQTHASAALPSSADGGPADPHAAWTNGAPAHAELSLANSSHGPTQA